MPPLAAHAWVSPLRATPSGDRPTVIRSLSGRLAVRAEPRPAARDSDLLDRRAAAVARLVESPVGVELALHPALAAVRAAVVAERRALAGDAVAQRIADGARQAAQLVRLELAGPPQ